MLRRSLAPLSISEHYLHSADSYPTRSVCQHGTTTGGRGRGPGPSTRELPGLDLRPVGGDPAGVERVGHRCPRAVDRYRRRDRRQAFRGDGPDDRRGHPRHRPARAGGLRPAHRGPGRPTSRRRRGHPRAGRDRPVAARVARARQRRGGRPVLGRAARAHQRLPVADGRPDPDRGRPAADVTRGRSIGADRPVRARGAAGRPPDRPAHVPVRCPGPPPARRSLTGRSLPCPLRRRHPAGPRP